MLTWRIWHTGDRRSRPRRFPVLVRRSIFLTPPELTRALQSRAYHKRGGSTSSAAGRGRRTTRRRRTGWSQPATRAEFPAADTRRCTLLRILLLHGIVRLPSLPTRSGTLIAAHVQDLESEPMRSHLSPPPSAPGPSSSPSFAPAARTSRRIPYPPAAPPRVDLPIPGALRARHRARRGRRVRTASPPRFRHVRFLHIFLIPPLWTLAHGPSHATHACMIHPHTTVLARTPPCRATHPTSHWHLPTPASTPASPPASVARKYIPIVSFARYPSLSLSAIAFPLARAFSLVVFLPPSVDLGLLYLGTFLFFLGSVVAVIIPKYVHPHARHLYFLPVLFDDV